MIDHIGMSVRDIARATEFYRKALAPLGISVVKEVSAEDTGSGAAVGFGANWKPFFWIGEGFHPAGDQHIHVAFTAPSREAVDAFYAAAIAAGARTTGRRVCARFITRIITAPSCSTPTATTSRPCVTCLSEPTLFGCHCRG